MEVVNDSENELEDYENLLLLSVGNAQRRISTE